MLNIDPNPPLIQRHGRFVDPEGRQVILHGANLANKDPHTGYLGATAADYAAMRRWGFNTVRLAVFWDGLEPAPGIFNEEYMRAIGRQADLAAAHGLYIFLDMHQDLYSVLYSDGAPAWATLAGEQPHVIESEVWSDAYFTSPAVQAALDNFWRNAPAPDGIGLQEHYAQTWGRLAERFAAHPAVVGYDLMNEPFPGSAALESQMALFTRGAALLAELDGPSAPSAEELALQWLDPAGRFAILQRLESAGLFAQVIDAAAPYYTAFEQQALMALYRRAARVIRAVDPHKILFLETSMGSNMGVISAIEPLQQPGGAPDPSQAYAPHGYDLVVDTASIASASLERVKLIFSRHGETARRLGLPMLVGEWGAFDGLPGTLPAAWMIAQQFERELCGDTYWLYESRLDQLPPFQAISRAYPERVAGTLESYACDPARGTFTCCWRETGAVRAPSRFYLPAWTVWSSRRIRLDPPGSGFALEPDGAGNAWLSVPPLSEQAARVLSIE